MSKFVTLTFTRQELADALCRTNLLSVWDERADTIIGILSMASDLDDARIDVDPATPAPSFDYALSRIGRDVRLELVKGADVIGRLIHMKGNNRNNGVLTIEAIPQGSRPTDVVPLRNVTRIRVRG